MAWRRSTLEAVGGFSTEIGRQHGPPLTKGGRGAFGARGPGSSLPLYGCEETIAGIQATSGNDVIVHAEHSIAYHYVDPARVSLRYLLRRCWGEGVSKEFVQHVSGRRLDEESLHVVRIVRSLVRYSLCPEGWRSVAFSILGLSSTTAGFLYGRGLRITRSRKRAATEQVLVAGD